VALAATLSVFASAQNRNGVSPALLQKLDRGVNVTRWFCYVQNPNDDAHFETYLGDQDFAAFRKLHVGFVRLCVSPEVIYREGAPEAKNLSHIDEALKRFHRA